MMGDYYVEMMLECPNCGTHHNYEVVFNDNFGTKGANVYFDTTKEETIVCDECDQEFNVRSELEINLHVE